MLNFRIRDLMILIAIFAVGLTQLASENFAVAGAAVFCLVSMITVGILVLISGAHLISAIDKSIRERTVLPFVSRLKWLMLDMIIVVWLVAIISTSNFVFETAESGGRQLLLGGCFVAPLLSVWIYLRFNREQRLPANGQ